MATRPFSPLQASATAGAGIKLTTVSASNVTGSITINSPQEANSLLITNGGASGAGTGQLVFVRVSAEATPTATSADIPVAPGRSVIVQNPVQPNGTIGVAVKASASGSNDVYITPIETAVKG